MEEPLKSGGAAQVPTSQGDAKNCGRTFTVGLRTRKTTLTTMFTPIEPTEPRKSQKIFKHLQAGEVREVNAKSLSALKNTIRQRMKLRPGESYSINEQGPPFQIRRES
jgi:hypothetical protein